jgi:chromosomal replication initiator protein
LQKKVKAGYNIGMSEHNYREVWQYAMSQIESEYKNNGKETEFKLWFNLEYIEDTINTITVAVASDFLWQTMIKKGNIEIIKKKIEELTGQSDLEIKSLIKNTSVIEEKETISQKETQIPQQMISQEKKEIKKDFFSIKVEEPLKKHPQLRSDYTFDSFVPGDNSIYAYNASIAAAKNPGRAYNPILLYGGVGLGKTHLMQAIGNYIYQQRSELKICYVSAETFTNEFTSSIKNKTTDKFKNKYRKLDVLLLDDIHFLQSKEMTQEELFHTFNALYDNNSQMVFTCDRPITELKGIADRLKTRFSRGLSIDLQPPNYETRHAILLKKLELLGKTIPEDVISYIAKNVVTNVRDLESSLTKMIGYSELINKKLTIQIAQEQLRDTFSSPLSGTITIENIQKVVADHFSVSVSDIKSKKRDKKFVIPRQIALYIARELTEYSFPELGNEFGGRDHTTAMHSYSKVESQLKTNSALYSEIQLLEREIKDYKK